MTVNSNMKVHRMRPARSISLSERVVSSLLGAFFGAAIGAVLMWLFGVYSQTIGAGQQISNPIGWMLVPASALAVLGFIAGSHVGSAIGTIISAIFEFERQGGDFETPNWLIITFLVGVVAAVAWWLNG